MAASTACNICRNILVGFMLTHTEDTCPLRRSAYCSTCASYGHFTKSCERTIAAKAVQQRDATAAIKREAAATKKSSKEILELPDKEECIRTFLLSRSIPISQKKGKNKELLYEFAEANNMEVVLH